MKRFKEFTLSFPLEILPLTEAIQFNHGAKYGQIVILAGGSGSGKGFIKQSLLDLSNFKIRDTDSLKKSYLNLITSKSKSNQILSKEEKDILEIFKKLSYNINAFLKNPQYTQKLHQYINTVTVNRINQDTITIIKDEIAKIIPKIIQDDKNPISEEKFTQLDQWLQSYIKQLFTKLFKGRPPTSYLTQTGYKIFWNNLKNEIGAFDFNEKRESIINYFTKKVSQFIKSILNDEDMFPKDLETLKQSISTSKEDHLPNLLFDITLQDDWLIKNIIPKFIALGYKPENIHLVWILVDIDVAAGRNLGRARVVNPYVTKLIHTGVISTVLKLLTHQDNLIPDYLNGDIYIIDNSNKNIEDIGSSRDKKITHSVKYTPISNIKKQEEPSYFIKNTKDNNIIYKIKKAGNSTVDSNQVNKVAHLISTNIEKLQKSINHPGFKQFLSTKEEKFLNQLAISKEKLTQLELK